MFLCIGPTNGGKTSLLEQIHHGNLGGCEELPTTVPTVGTNLTVISGKKRKSNILIRELGGVMAPIWPSYFPDCRGIVFVIDAGNKIKLAVARVLLTATLSHSSLIDRPTLVALNKVDIYPPSRVAEMGSLLSLDSLRQGERDITVMKTSVKTGAGTTQVMEWLRDHAS